MTSSNLCQPPKVKLRVQSPSIVFMCHPTANPGWYAEVMRILSFSIDRRISASLIENIPNYRSFRKKKMSPLPMEDLIK